MRATCPYCGHPFEIAELTDEHIFPQKLGGNLIVRTCQPCNRGAADYVGFEHSSELAPWVWPRFAAKVALGVGHLVVPGFHRSVAAGMLRGLFREGKTFKGMFPSGVNLGVVPTTLDETDREPTLLL